MELLYFPHISLSHAEQYRWSVNFIGMLFWRNSLDLEFENVNLNLVTICMCAQVSDAVPGRCARVSILPVLCEDQETVGSCFATGEEKW